MDPVSILGLLAQYGALAALVLIAYGGMTGKFLWRTTHEEIVALWRQRVETCDEGRDNLLAERDYYRDALLKALNAAETVTRALPRQ